MCTIYIYIDIDKRIKTYIHPLLNFDFQVIVQRTLAAKDMTHVKGGCVFAGYLKLLPIWIMVFPGMAARVLFKDEVACATPENCEKICSSK